MYMLNNRVEKLIGEIRGLLVVKSQKIEKIEIRRGIISFPCDITKITDGFESFEYGELWSEPKFNNYALFRFEATIPEEYNGKKVVLRVSTNQAGGVNALRPQMLAFINGKPVQGLDTNHERVLLSSNAKAGDKYSIHIYAFSGLTTTMPEPSIALKEAEGVRFYADLQVRDDELCDYYYNLSVPFSYLKYLDESHYDYQTILTALNESLTKADLRNPHSEEFYKGIREANKFLKEGLYSKKYTDNGKVTLVGHTHIDVAWLWQYKHTRDKVARSFATAIKMLEEQDKHRFIASQAQLYTYAKEEQPELYKKIKELVKEGKWEAEGAMWVEPDMNLTSGEFIVRQILYGKKFFKEEFDVDCRVLWLPDVFGYSAALPQILKKSGVDYFMTAKLFNNELNRFPFDTFLWKGIDGSEVFSHLLNYCGYNPPIENGYLLRSWNWYKNKDINDDVLLPFGFSDGGGGPTEEQIESIKRLENGLPGVPQTKIGKVRDYFEDLEKRVINNRKLPVWSGEMYFEFHRGTYTSMGRVKKQNRKGEILYLNAEWLWSLASLFGGEKFPKKEFDKGITNILVNQFHDVLPGSSIKEVYDDTDVLYEESFEIGEKICKEAIEVIAGKIGADENSVLVFNPYGEKADGYVSVDGKPMYVENVPAKGYALYPKTTKEPIYPVAVKNNVIENQYYEIKLNDNGEIEYLYDKKAERQCFKKGACANVLRVFEDKPYFCDNWNIDVFYTEREFEMPAPDRITVVEKGGERAIVEIARKYQKSDIVQRIIVYANSRRIDFETEIDWKEDSQVLRTYFPVDVNTTRATYEIQFGHVERPTTKNTTWEDAKFEVCAHKWADISDNGYGMALMNDCKYGYSAHNSTLSMTLLKCGHMPYPDADKEKHSFTYSILPHKGSFIEAEVVKEAYMLNNPMLAVEMHSKAGAQIPQSFSMLEVSGAVLEAVKPAEDGNGYILRIYEANNQAQKAIVKCGMPVADVQLCDLMERPTEMDAKAEYDETTNTIQVPVKPFEIVTLRVNFK